MNNWKIYINKKNTKQYLYRGEVINATNDNDGQIMILYTNVEGQKFVREKSEFFEKFEPFHKE